MKRNNVSAFVNMLIFAILTTFLSSCYEDPTARDIYFAATEGDTKTIKKLLNEGFDVNKPDTDGETPLTSAVAWGHLETVKYLLSKGADVNHVNNSGDASLSMVGFVNSKSKKDNLKIVKLLLEHGANIDFQDENGDTALYIATMYGKVYLIEELLKKGANPQIKNNDGNYPILNVCSDIKGLENKMKVLDMLLAKGADINTQYGDNETLASDEDCTEDKEFFDYLKSKGLTQ